MAKKKKKKGDGGVEKHLKNMQSIINMAASLEQSVPDGLEMIYSTFRNLMLIELVRFSNEMGKDPTKLEKLDIRDTIAHLIQYAKDDEFLQDILREHEDKADGDNDKVDHSPTGYL